MSTLYRRCGRDKNTIKNAISNEELDIPKGRHNKGEKINPWNEENMKEAISDIHDGVGGLRKIAKNGMFLRALYKSGYREKLRFGNIPAAESHSSVNILKSN